MKFETLLQEWMTEKQVYKLKKRTYLRYQELIRTQIIPTLGEYETESLTVSVLQAFQRTKQEQGNLRTGQPLANNTVKNITSIIKGAIRFGRTEKQLPLLNPNDVPTLPFAEKPVEVFRKDEQRRIEDTVAQSKKANHFGIVLCLYTGLRLGELLGLTWKDIDFQCATLTVNKTSCFIKDTDGKYKIIVDRPKTQSSVRVIPLPKPILRELKALHKKSKSEFLISTCNGGRVSNRSYQTTYKKVLKKAKVEYRKFHTTRHTFATRALECGMDIKTLADILGHKSPAITMNRYVHSLMETKKKMMNLLAKSLAFGKEKKCAV